MASGHLLYDLGSSDLMLLGIVNLKQTARYFSSKDRFIQNQQRTSIQDVQVWQATCKSSHRKERKTLLNRGKRDFPGGPVVKNPPCDAGDVGSIPG